MLSKILTIISGLISIFSGIYLAGTRAAGSNSLMETLIIGIGWYCIARGIYMIASMAHITSLLEKSQCSNPDDSQECRACMSFVHKFAHKCKHCGSELAAQ